MTLIWPFYKWICLNKLSALRFVFLVTGFLLLFPSYGKTQEYILYNPPKTHKEKQVVAFAQNNADSSASVGSWVLADIDLNNDLIEEYIVRPDVCDSTALCPYFVVAVHEFTPVLLLKVSANKIQLASTTVFGVRDLIIYNQLYNDFENKEFGWNPYKQLYEQKEFQ